MNGEGSRSDAEPVAAAAPVPGPARTLAAMWGKEDGASAGTSGSSTPGSGALTLDSSPASGSGPQARKRRKKEPAAAANQGRLTFTNGGVGVAPPPPPVEDKEEGGEKEKKKRGKRVSDEHDVVAIDTPPPKRRGKATKPAAKKPKGNAPIVIDDDFSILSPDSSPPRAGELRVTGGQGRGASGSRASSPILVDGPPTPLSTAAPTKGPRKIVFASDSKPAHSFFAKREPAPAPAAPAIDVDTPSLPSSPPVGESTAQPNAPPAPKPAVHSFFDMKVRKAGITEKGWGRVREGEEPLALWPGGEWPQHEGYLPVEPVEDCVPRTTGRATATEDDNDDPQVRLADFTPSLSTPTPEFRPTAVPSFILEHPAIRAVLSTPADAREAWCDVHRPRTAAAVLGNELEATYLRDWLSALSVGSREARRVVRRVPRRRRENDSDWIVDDTGGLYGGLEGEEFAGELDGEVEVPEPADEPVFPLGGRPDTYPPIEYWIGNALLLSGPTGSGKTAAVHAAAAELGWDVFEVYPGIGRRSGANLLALVGEVGKNHMVVDKKGDAKKEEREKETEKAKTAAAKASFFGAARVKEKGKVSGSQEAPIELDEPEAEVQPQPVPVEVEARKPAEEPETPAPAATKQSLILIDEADILFEEESTFWPAIVKLIADSHRPVVITCNDLVRIPRDSLPLHTTLYFQPLPPYLAQPYLATIAQHHGVEVDAADVYAQCSLPPVDLVDCPLPPNGNEPAARFDLRAAITQMQLDRGVCGRADPEEMALQSAEAVDFFDSLADLVHALEAVSFADAHLAPRASARIEVYEIDRLAPGPDDEDGPRALLKPAPSDTHPALAAFDHSMTMACATAALGGRSQHWSYRASNLRLAQTAHVRRVLPALDEVVTLAGRLLPHPTLFTDTLPYLRTMVRTDDALAAADAAAAASGALRFNRAGRVVRGASRGYDRHIVMQEGALREMAAGGLWDWE